MKKEVKVLPNQSLADMIIAEYGSLEAGMAVAAQNGIDISHVPVPGDYITMPDVGTEKMDLGNAEYIRRNDVTIGTLSQPELSFSIVLKPVMVVQPTESGDPHALGYYAFALQSTADFVNANPLVNDYLSENPLNYETEERYIAGHLPEHSGPSAISPMPATSIPYHLPWTVGLGYMLVWSELSNPVVTPTFRDNQGNEAYCAPLTLLDNVDMAVVIDRLIGDISIDVVATSQWTITLRLTRSHTPIVLADFADHTMQWLGVAATGSPDPDDPGNPDKTMLYLTAGTYTLGLKTNYFFPGGVPVFPSSAFTMVISVN